MSQKRAEDVFPAFLKAAELLEKERESVDEIIEKWDQKLRELCLHLETWVGADGSHEPGPHGAVELGYRDGLVVRSRKDQEFKVEPLAEAAYDVKIEALVQLPRLLADLRTVMNNQITRLQRLKELTGFDALRKHLRKPFMHAGRKYSIGEA